MPPLVVSSLSELPAYTGSDLGCTEWLTIDPERVLRFAEATGDTRWIHVDPERAARESPWKGTVVDGYLLLSLVPDLLARLITLFGWSRAINTGVDYCEFPEVVVVGSRVRLRARIARARGLPVGGCRLSFDTEFEVEGRDAPGCRARVNYAYFA